MSFTRRLVLGVTAVIGAWPLHSADDKKPDKKEPPTVTMAVPFAVVPGRTNQIVVRGLSLTNASEIQILSARQPLRVEIKSRGKATIPDKAEAKKVGDTQLEVELVLPEDTPMGGLPFVVQTPDGPTNTNLLYVVPEPLLLFEKEPNPGFRKSNSISVPQVIQGTMGEANDVDVFRFQGKAGQNVVAETRSADHGSLLDPIVTLHDDNGHVLATSDDARGRDARLEHVLPKDGFYFLSINDAHDRGGIVYGYLLEVRGTRLAR
jgi:hypothetical protein